MPIPGNLVGVPGTDKDSPRPVAGGTRLASRVNWPGVSGHPHGCRRHVRDSRSGASCEKSTGGVSAVHGHCLGKDIILRAGTQRGAAAFRHHGLPIERRALKVGESKGSASRSTVGCTLACAEPHVERDWA